MARSASAAGPAAFQPWLPRLTATIVSIALSSCETNGPVTCPRYDAGRRWRSGLASAAAFALSAAVRPLGRSYTTTAGYTLGDTNCERRFSTCVDSARGGSHA